MSNDDDFWQLISAVKNINLENIEKYNEVEEFFIALEKEYLAVKNKKQIKTEYNSAKLFDMSNMEGNSGIFAKLFRRKRSLATEYMMCFLKNTSKFSKNDLYLILKLNLLKPINKRAVSLDEGETLSQISTVFISTLLSVVFFIWAINLYFSSLVGTKELTLSVAAGIFIGIGIRYIFDRTIKKRQLIAGLKMVAPQLSQT